MKRSTIKFVILSLLFALVMPAAILFVACDTNPPATCKLVYVIGGEKYKEVDVSKHSSVSSERAAELFGETKTGFSLDGWYADREKTREFEGVTDITSKVFLYGDWVRNRYTLTYVFGNGNDDLVLPLEYEQIIPSEDDPERTAYDFDGWDTEIPETMPAHDLIITATWTPIEYDITFDENGGEEVEDVKYTIESPTFVLPIATKTGWVFDGWFDGTTKYEQVALGSYGDLNLVAEWHLDSFVIRYEVDGETYAEQTYEYGEAVVLPDTPQKTGYTFGGWDTEIPETMPAHDILARATWTANEYSVLFKGNQPADAPYDIDPQQDVVQNFVYGTAQDLTANSFVLAGYDFDRWTTAADGSGTSYNNGQNVVNLASTEGAQFELYAKWNPHSYTLTIVDNAGEHSMPYDIKTHIEAPAGASKTGYEFEYWIVTSGTGAWAEMIGAHIETGDTADNMYGDVTLEAQYAICNYTMTFVVDGVTVSSQNYDYGESVVAPADPTKERYTFVGWTPDAPETMPAHDETCVAQWQINNWTMTYLADGKVYDTQHYDYGASVVAPADPTKEGWEFDRWNPAVPATMPDNDVTVEAVFVQYTLEIVRSHDVADVNVQAATVTTSGTVFTLEYDPETLYLGYDWLGWWDGETLLSTLASYEYVMPAANKTITAKFAVKGEMSNFVFEASDTTCVIKGVVDKSVDKIYVPDYVTSIAQENNNGAFAGCYNLKQLRVPFVGLSKTTSTSSQAAGYWAAPFKMSTKTNPDTNLYTTVKSQYYVPNLLTKIILSKGVIIRTSQAFSYGDTTTLTDIYYEGTLSDWCLIDFTAEGKNPISVSGVLHYLTVADSDPTNIDDNYSVIGSTFVTPNNINAIKRFAFAGFDEIENVVITNNIQTIGASVFVNCTNLRNVFVEAGAFADYDSSITASAFNGCTNLKLYVYGSESQYSNVVYKFSSVNAFDGVQSYLYYEDTLPTLPGYYWTYDSVDPTQIETETVEGLKFNTKGGSDVEPILVAEGTDISGMEPENPSREGYDFDGWYTDYGCTEGNEFVFGTMPSGVTVVYAKWVVTANPEPEPEPTQEP